MEVVQEPFGRGRDELSSMDRLRERLVSPGQHPGVVLEAGKEISRPAPGPGINRETGGQCPSTLVQPLDAQQLVTKRPLCFGGGPPPKPAFESPRIQSWFTGLDDGVPRSRFRLHRRL